MPQENFTKNAKPPRVFISYSWESEGHKDWVRYLAENLRMAGIDARLDQWYVKPGESFTSFMENEVVDADYVLVVCTPEFARKSKERRGGVGYEQQIVSGQLVTGCPRSKFIPILRSGELSGSDIAVPIHFFGIYSIDFRKDAEFGRSLNELLRALFSRPKFVPPPLGEPPALTPEEIQKFPQSSDEKPLEFLPSSTTAGFVGLTERGRLIPTNVYSWEDYKQKFGDEIDPSISYLTHSVKGFFDNGGSRAVVARICGKGASTAILNLAPNLNIRALHPGIWGNRIYIGVQMGTRTGYNLTLYYYRSSPASEYDNINVNTNQNLPDADIQEDYDNLSFEPKGPNYALDMVNHESNLVCLELSDDRPVQLNPSNDFFALKGGSDGLKPLAEDYIGSTSPNETGSGLSALGLINGIQLLCIPDQEHSALPQPDREEIMNAMIDQCQRLNDRFAILSSYAFEDNIIAIKSPPDTSYAAMYFPWIRVFDSYTKSNILIPAVGHIAGIYAQNDARQGIHKAPVSIPIKGIVQNNGDNFIRPLEFDVSIDQQDILNRKGFNVLRNFGKEKYDIRSATAYTMSIDRKWRYVHVCRFSIYLINSIKNALSWVWFERNEEMLWTKVQKVVSDFLTRTWEEKALGGHTSKEAFFVRCDRTTMTQSDIDNGRLICFVSVAMADPPISLAFNLVLKTATNIA